MLLNLVIRANSRDLVFPHASRKDSTLREPPRSPETRNSKPETRNCFQNPYLATTFRLFLDTTAIAARCPASFSFKETPVVLSLNSI